VHKERQMYVLNAGKYQVEVSGIAAVFPEIKFAFSLTTATNGAETANYIDNDYYLIPVYYSGEQKAFLPVSVSTTLTPSYLGLPVVSVGDACVTTYDYSPVTEREMIYNWLSLGTNNSGINIPLYE